MAEFTRGRTVSISLRLTWNKWFWVTLLLTIHTHIADTWWNGISQMPSLSLSLCTLNKLRVDWSMYNAIHRVCCISSSWDFRGQDDGLRWLGEEWLADAAHSRYRTWVGLTGKHLCIRYCPLEKQLRTKLINKEIFFLRFLYLGQGRNAWYGGGIKGREIR